MWLNDVIYLLDAEVSQQTLFSYAGLDQDASCYCSDYWKRGFCLITSDFQEYFMCTMFGRNRPSLQQHMASTLIKGLSFLDEN